MDDNEQMLARLREGAQLTARTGLARYTCFLDPALARHAQAFAREQRIQVDFWGGYAGAERIVARFCESDADEPWPVVCLRARRNTRFASPITHRDVLGAAMGLGLKRERIGDILVSDTDVFLFTLRENAPYIEANLESAGREKLCFARVEGEMQLPEPKGREVRDTVASLRLDAVLSAAFSLSRAQAQEAIRTGKVRVDHIEELRTDVQLEEGALLSLRGAGRARLTQIGSLTRKGRVGIVLFRYE